MKPLDQELSERLEGIKQHHLYRELGRVDSPQGRVIRAGGREFLNFASNDYLSLANHPKVKSAAREALEEYGAGAGASRLLCGSLAPLHQLEEELARFKGAEAALTFSTGYATALGTIGALAGRNDIVIIDKLSHACIVDGARLSGATLRVFDHNDMRDLEAILGWAAGRVKVADSRNKPSILVVTESVFSMDGDFAPLPELVALKERYGVWLMLDEAHATGLYGRHGRGLADHFGVADRVEVQMGTLGKALGSSGGYICGSRLLIDYLVNRVRTFIFSTAPVPAAAAAARAAVELVQSPSGSDRRRHLQSLVQHWIRAWGAGTGRRQHDCETAESALPAILPVIIGDEAQALAAAGKLKETAIFVPAIRYPTVPRGTARLRVSLSAAHTHEDLDSLISALHAIGVCPRPTPAPADKV